MHASIHKDVWTPPFSQLKMAQVWLQRPQSFCPFTRSLHVKRAVSREYFDIFAPGIAEENSG